MTHPHPTEEALVAVAQDAGRVLLEHYRRLAPGEIARKGGKARDLVTVADTASESLILDRFARDYPHIAVLSEESGAHGKGSARFVIDPLDGTTNFSMGLQHFAVSIALVEDGEATLGVVHVPVLGETFSATRGNGARLNGEPIRVSPRTLPEEFFVATGFACVRAGHDVNNLTNIEPVHLAIRDLRRLGSAAIDLAYVACGIFDAFWELSLSAWDIAAGTLLVQEAGGTVTDLDGGDGWRDGASILATNGAAHAHMMSITPVHWAGTAPRT